MSHPVRGQRAALLRPPRAGGHHYHYYHHHYNYQFLDYFFEHITNSGSPSMPRIPPPIIHSAPFDSSSSSCNRSEILHSILFMRPLHIFFQYTHIMDLLLYIFLHYIFNSIYFSLLQLDPLKSARDHHLAPRHRRPLNPLVCRG